MIRLSQVTLKIKDRLILDSIDLAVAPQEAIGIIGPSGEGKSIVLKLIAGLMKPTQGEVQVGSEKVSMLFQKNALFDSMTLLQNLLVPLSETRGIEGSDAESRAIEMLAAVGLADSAQLHPDEISGGMQKRLGIARALIIEPEVILYDEPTAGLDPITSSSIAELMLKLHHQNKTTLVMVTNDLQRAYQVSDRILFCSGGHLHTSGTPAEVKATQDPILRNFIYSSAITQEVGVRNP